MSAPAKTNERLVASVRALIGHCWNRLDRRELILAAARKDARHRLAEAQREIDRIRGRLPAAAAHLDAHAARAQILARLAREHAGQQYGGGSRSVAGRCRAGPPRGAARLARALA